MIKEKEHVILKLSGEALTDSRESLYSQNILKNITEQISYLIKKYHLKIGIVIGGGNIFRGSFAKSLGMIKNEETADHMGMLATTINALALNIYLKNAKIKSIVLNAREIKGLLSEASEQNIRKSFLQNDVIIFGGGTGKPYVSTDTAAALRAIDSKSSFILMAKNNIDGIYDKDPNRFTDAKFLKKLTFKQFVDLNLQAIDHQALKKLEGTDIKVIVFNMNDKNNIIKLYEDKLKQKTILAN
ncbi:MAG: uridylate kinase [Candidatus Hepatoplasma scabrum]|nr:MAG: uridylate kinase [Candidatus Hepatoplasma sp.]